MTVNTWAFDILKIPVTALSDEIVYNLLLYNKGEFPIHEFFAHPSVKEPILSAFYKIDSILYNPNLSQKAFDLYTAYCVKRLGEEKFLRMLQLRNVKVPTFSVLQWASKYPQIDVTRFCCSDAPFSTARHHHKGITRYCAMVNQPVVPDWVERSSLYALYATLTATYQQRMEAIV